MTTRWPVLTLSSAAAALGLDGVLILLTHHQPGCVSGNSTILFLAGLVWLVGPVVALFICARRDERSGRSPDAIALIGIVSLFAIVFTHLWVLVSAFQHGSDCGGGLFM
ncbi:MAG TPA: hypothetical protein VF379_09065 [Gaiellaceae bacterium]